MGGRGSGRQAGLRMMVDKCHEYHSIDLAWLRRKKLFNVGRWSSLTWSRAGRETGSIRIECHANDVSLVYRHRRHGEDWQDVNELVPLVELPTRFGGTRQWFLCPIPGGPGMNALLEDDPILAFVRRQGEQARYVTSVCTGALVLGAAGLLKGYKAATHWASMEFLPAFGATPVKTRVCIDRNRITGGGVTAGIDFGLYLAAQLTDRKTAEKIQLYIEYNPEPPFQAGSPHTAPSEVVGEFRTYVQSMLSQRREAVARAAAKLA